MDDFTSYERPEQERTREEESILVFFTEQGLGLEYLAWMGFLTL